MSRIAQAFARARAEDRKALITYVCAGDPSLEATFRVVPALARGGADIIELGVPFSDPIADGPTIQAASHRALLAGANLEGILDGVAGLRRAEHEVPIVLMTYLNPLVSFGLKAFFDRAGAAGVDGVIIPDLPLEECGPILDGASGAGVDVILLAAPTTSEARLAQIGQRTQGFLYFVSVTGVTGARAELPPELPQLLTRAQKASAAPVAVGFGVSTAAQVRELARFADAVVVGSALVRVVHESGADADAVERFVRELASGTRP